MRDFIYPHKVQSNFVNSFTLTKEVAGYFERVAGYFERVADYFERKLTEIPQVNATHFTIL
jgi:hypothetical protein